ncbi:MAG: hypothetical protein AB7I41_18835 [Candidatus Sericytochromatia bacterium]
MRNILSLSLILLNAACTSTTGNLPISTENNRDTQQLYGQYCGVGGVSGLDCDAYRQGKGQLLDEQRKPLKNQSFQWNQQILKTDAEGYFGLPAPASDPPVISLEGYWPYNEALPTKPVFLLSLKDAAERSGQAGRFDNFSPVSLSFGPGGEMGLDFSKILPTEKGYSYFLARSESELEQYLQKLKPFYDQTGKVETLEKQSMSLRESFKQGKVIAAISNNVIFRYFPMVDQVFSTPESWTFSVNRSVRLSFGGNSGHSYDLQLMLLAVPADREKLVFHLEKGPLELNLKSP